MGLSTRGSERACRCNTFDESLRRTPRTQRDVAESEGGSEAIGITADIHVMFCHVCFSQSLHFVC